MGLRAIVAVGLSLLVLTTACAAPYGSGAPDPTDDDPNRPTPPGEPGYLTRVGDDDGAEEARPSVHADGGDAGDASDGRDAPDAGDARDAADAADVDAGPDELVVYARDLADGDVAHVRFGWQPDAVGALFNRDLRVFVGQGSPVLSARTADDGRELASVFELSWSPVQRDMIYDLRIARTSASIDVSISPPLGGLSSLAHLDASDPHLVVKLPNAARFRRPIQLY